MEKDMLQRLAISFSVIDIMIAERHLKRADNYNNANHLLDEYDVVPYPRKDRMEGFFSRHSKEITYISMNYILSSNTSLFELPALFRQQPFFFVVSSSNIVGYVHYSDLNKNIAKIPFFAMSQIVERNLWDKMSYRISEEVVRKLFPSDANKFFGKRKEAIERNVDIGWAGIFTFPYILKLARHFGLIHLTDEEIKLLKEMRNRVAHSDNNLIEKYEDVESLATATELSQSLLNETS